MVRPYVKYVESDIKCGVKSELGPKTLILGPRGSGKSAHVNAIELALKGSASDIAGRPVMAKDSDLWQLAPAGAESIFSNVLLSDGQKCSWSLEPGHRAKLISPFGPDVFPLQDVRSALLGSVETARKFILGQLSPEKYHWRGVIPPSLKEKFAKELTSELVPLLETAKRKARELTSDSAEHERRSRDLAQGLAPEGETLPVQSTDTGALEVEISRLQAEVTALAEQYRNAKTELEALPASTITAEQLEFLQPMFEVMAWHVKNEQMQCLVCGESTGHIGERAKKLKAKMQAHVDLAQKRSALTQSCGNLKQRGMLLQAQLKAAQAEMEVVNQPVPSSGTGWAQVREQQDLALRKKAQAAEWKDLAEACALALKGCLSQAREAFEAQVQRCLPEGQIFKLELNHGESEVFRFGLRDELTDHIRYALSRGEEAMVLCAMTMVLGPSEGLSIVVPPEAGWDPEGLAETLSGWEHTDRQVIITSTTTPKTVSDKWTVINLER
jgi:energy-coupling factor transporter ATP-binding protein EcfA2